VDQDGNLLCYRERTWRRLDAEQIALKIRKVEMEAGEWDEKKDGSRLSGPIDTQIWEERGTIGPTIFESMSKNGVWWEKATKNRLQATQQFMSRLKDRSGEQGIPGIRFFDTCKETLRTLPAIGTSATDPELPEDGGDDHWLDAVSYACMYRPGKGAKTESKSTWEEHEDDLAQARKRRQRQRGSGKYGYGAW
jgi:hypothetical protein